MDQHTLPGLEIPRFEARNQGPHQHPELARVQRPRRVLCIDVDGPLLIVFDRTVVEHKRQQILVYRGVGRWASVHVVRYLSPHDDDII